MIMWVPMGSMKFWSTIWKRRNPLLWHWVISVASVWTFMGRFQLDLKHLRRECREHFGSTQSGLCTFCGKYMDLAQLWRCPVTWCTVCRGMPQDCIDHMRKAHSIPATVKAANLACWFPPWTVSREQWTSIMRSSVSGVAVDTLLFSRIGVPLFHRYRVFSRPGTHVAFRGTYLTRIRTFLRNLMPHLWDPVIVVAPGRLLSSSQPSTSRQPGSLVRKSALAAAVSAASLTPVVVRSLRSSPRAILALMDLVLPRFAIPEPQSERPRSPWIVTSESPAPLRLPAPLRSPSLFLSLDTLSSAESAGPGDVSAHPICISDMSSHSGDPDQVLSDDDLPPEVRVVDLPLEGRVDFTSYASCVCADVALFASGGFPCPVSAAAGASGGTVYGRDGIMASSDGSGLSRACAGFVLQCVHELSVLFPGWAGSIREVTVYIIVLAGRHSSVAGDRSPAFTNDCHQSCYELTLIRLVGWHRLVSCNVILWWIDHW